MTMPIQKNDRLRQTEIQKNSTFLLLNGFVSCLYEPGLTIQLQGNGLFL
ncbi:MAG TPA: hypothetical protein V6C65_15835 [Allocoleopsis sp.]